MASINAEKVATRVLETLGRGEKVILGKIVLESGYSYKMSLNPKEVTKGKTYKNIMRPIIEGIQEEIERTKLEIANKDLTKVQYDSLVRGLDTLIKNYQLLSGGVTEKSEVKITGFNYISPNDTDNTAK